MYGYQSGKGGGINLDFRVNRYILLSARWINKKDLLETCLVVQWLELHTPNAGDPGSVSGGGARSHMPITKSSQAARRSEDPAYHS